MSELTKKWEQEFERLEEDHKRKLKNIRRWEIAGYWLISGIAALFIVVPIIALLLRK